ncbi:MAG: hypothetical protein AAGC90_10430, partial [Curtobacterium sp.]
PITLNDVTFKVEDDNYEAAVSSVSLDPQSGLATFKGMTPSAVFNFPQATTWQAAITFAQDWETEDSLSNYLFDHQGETVTVQFAPKRGGRTWEVDLVIVPGSIGGAVDAVATSTVTCGVSGQPRRATTVS